MREIKFRAWSNFYKGWVESFCIKDGRVHLGSAVYIGNQVKDAILMQYTGLLDKNGAEIYEGDLLKGQYSCLGICKFHRSWGSFYFATVYSKNEYGDLVLSSSAVPFWNDSNKFEIIGNIYENHELLKEEAK